MTNINDAQQHRLLYLGLIFLWEGRLNNARLRELFSLSQVRASEWIREFREKHPDWMYLNTRTRSYHATPEAYRSFETSATQNSETLARYLALVGLPHATPADHGNRVAWAAFPDLSTPKPRIFAALNEAIRMRQAIEITYRSMREPTPHKRIISPHSLVRAGRRWHARAYCSTNQDFRDYTLGRIVDTRPLGHAAERLETDDVAWMTQVQIRLVAHPDLSRAQEELIRFEYFNDTASRVQSCRGSLVSYFIQDIRAAMDVTTQRPPDYQLAVSNVKEVKPWLFPS